MTRDRFTFFRSYRDAAEALDGIARLNFYDEVIAYALDGKEPDFSDKVSKALFGAIRPNIEKGLTGYNNGKEGGAPRGNTNARKNNPKTTQKQPKNNQPTNQDKDKDKDKEQVQEENENPNTNQNAQARGEGREVNLSDYLTPSEEESLFEGVANFDRGFLERFVLSTYYYREDSLYQKAQKAIEFRKEEDAKEEAEKKEREEIEKAKRIVNYSTGQKPRNYNELSQFCKDMGRADFDAAGLMDEMEHLGWEIKDKDTGQVRPIRNWQKFVKFRLTQSPADEPRKAQGGQDWPTSVTSKVTPKRTL